MDQETADIVKNKVRGFLKTGKKSTNKIYSDNEKNTVYKTTKGEVEDEKTVTPDMKKKRLASAQEDVQVELQKLRDLRAEPKGSKTPLAYGKLLYKQNTPVGNCLEMASLAIFFLSIEQIKCYLVEIADPGDHVFCITATKKPTAKNITVLKNEDGAWVIDPWANLACPAADYMKFLGKKFETWNAAGKRVAWKNSKSSGWSSPTDSQYKVNTFFSNLEYTEGKETFRNLI